MRRKANSQIPDAEFSNSSPGKEKNDRESAKIQNKNWENPKNRKTFGRILLLLAFLSFSFMVLNASAEELLEPMRTWTSQKGKTIQGVWLPEKDSSSGNTISIQKKSGKIGKVKVSALSRSDQQYVRRRQAERRQSGAGGSGEIILNKEKLQTISTPPSTSLPRRASSSSAAKLNDPVGIKKYENFSYIKEEEYLGLIKEFSTVGKEEILKTHSVRKVDERRYLFSTAMYYKNLYDNLDLKNPSEDSLRMVICDRIEAFRMRFSQFPDCETETEWITQFEASILILDELLQKVGEAVALRDQKLGECKTIGEREQINAIHEEIMNALIEESTQKLDPLENEMLALEDQLVRKYQYVDYSAAVSSASLNVDAAIHNEDLTKLFDSCTIDFENTVLKNWENKNKSQILSNSAMEKADLKKTIAYLCYLASLVPEHSMYDIDRGVILKGITDSLLVYRLFEPKNFDLEFAIQCFKFTLAYFADNRGECRFGLMSILQAENRFDAALELAGEIIELYKGNYFFSLRLASLFVEKRDYERAFLWFEAAIASGALCEYVQTMQAGQPIYHADFLLIRPDVFCELQKQDPQRFANILRPNLSWDHRLGNEYDIFAVTNHSPFPVHNVKFKITFSDGNRTWTRTYYADRIEARDVLLGDTTDGNHCTVRYPTNTSAEIICDENSQR